VLGARRADVERAAGVVLGARLDLDCGAGDTDELLGFGYRVEDDRV